MDIITQKYFEKFLREMNIEGGMTEKNFEKFINYIILFPKNISNFNLASVTTGNGGDCAIDGLAITLNNKYVTNSTELQDLLNLGMDITVEFYFIQTKTSDSFDGSEMLQFGNGVCDVFKTNNPTTKVRNEKLKDKCKMIQILLDNYDSFSEPPKCYLYYVTTGTWVNDQNLVCDKQKIENDLNNLSLFDGNVELYPFGCTEIRRQYELTKLQNSSTFELKDKIELPYMHGVKESYLAIMPIKDYLNIIVDEQNKIKKGIFELNVRDFKGIEDNRVNQDIINTINSKDNNYFGLYNNGITIVGKSLKKGQGKYTIKNFYVVNGCQTTNVLHESTNFIQENMWISVKIVITEDDNIIKNIVKATNNQTEVEEIQLLSMTEYQQLLESYFLNFDKFYQLYYERREGQYNSENSIDKSRIISPEMQIRAFSSVFLESPHKASRFYGTLVDDIGKKIFINGHRPIMYYTSSLLLHHLENYFNNDKIDSKLLKFKYHLLLIISRLVWKDKKRPQANSKKMDDYCIILIEKILDKNEFKGLLNESILIISKVIQNLDDVDANKSVSIVNLLLMYVDINITHEGLRSIISFNNAMDIYLAPFFNMKIDGDLRYNFTDRLKELISKVSSYNMQQTANYLKTYLSKINTESKTSRKQCSKEIYNYINGICTNLNKKVELSKRYIQQ